MVWCRLVAKIKIKICIADFKLFLHPATQKTTNKDSAESNSFVTA